MDGIRGYIEENLDKSLTGVELFLDNQGLRDLTLCSRNGGPRQDP
jgi:hypothetical protein